MPSGAYTLFKMYLPKLEVMAEGLNGPELDKIETDIKRALDRVRQKRMQNAGKGEK